MKPAELIRERIQGLKTEREVLRMIRQMNLRYEDQRPAWCDYFNIRIPAGNGGYIRIYESEKGIFKVQSWA